MAVTLHHAMKTYAVLN